jgi:hypothetical protein
MFNHNGYTFYSPNCGNIVERFRNVVKDFLLRRLNRLTRAKPILGESFAVNASVLEAGASRYHGVAARTGRLVPARMADPHISKASKVRSQATVQVAR